MKTSADRGETLDFELFSRWGKRYFLLCSLFLIPTLAVLFQALNRHLSVSSFVMRAWYGQGWLHLGPHGALGGVLLSLFLYGLIEGCAFLFFKGMRLIEKLPEATAAEEQLRYSKLMRWVVFISLVLVWVIPFHSRDLYAYINYGAEQVMYGLDPYSIPVATLKGWHHSAMFHSNWVNFPSNYGFAFILLTRLLVALSFGHFFVAFGLFKLVNAAAHVAITGLIFQISKSLNLKKPLLNAYLYGLNPLMLLHFVANGHNDILMTLPVLLSFWLLFSLKRFQFLVVPLWTLGILIKYAVLVAAPLLVLFLWQTGQVQALWTGLSLSLGIAALLFLPFQDFGLRTIQAHPSWYEIKTQHSWQAIMMSLYQLLEKPFHALKGFRMAFQSHLSELAWASYLGLWGYSIIRAIKQFKEPQQLIRTTALLIALLICVANRMYHPWYVGLFFPLVLLLPAEDKLRRFGILLSFTQLISFTTLERSELISFLPTIAAWAWVYWPVFHRTPKAKPDLITT